MALEAVVASEAIGDTVSMDNRVVRITDFKYEDRGCFLCPCRTLVYRAIALLLLGS